LARFGWKFLFIRKTANSTIAEVKPNQGAMKTMKKASLALLSSIAALLIFSPAALAASSSQPLNLTVNGIITNAGSQIYSFSGGTVAAPGNVGPDVLSPGTSINFQVSAFVRQLNTNGHGSISDGKSTVSITINGENPAAVFPLDPTGNNCASNCNSQIPFAFTGMAVISSQGQGQGGWGQGDDEGQQGNQPTGVPILIESPYWNPGGAPILIVSLDSPTTPSIFLIVSYSHATIDWFGVTVSGTVSGTLGGYTGLVQGAYSSVTISHEDLVAGVEHDAGTISFSSMTPSSLNANGFLGGTTNIANPGADCSSFFGMPTGSGICLLTGATSSGSFYMFGHGGSIKGTYSTVWSTPSLFTTTTVAATVSQH
jgi:hypothetical protein